MYSRARTLTKLGATLLSAPYSRQCLPRPARFYSSPSKRNSAPAVESSPHFQPQDLPPFAPLSNSSSQSSSSPTTDMEAFLHRVPSYVMIPAPLPDSQSSPLNDFYFTDSPTKDQLAIMDACLYNLHDVSRAMQVFERLRESKMGDPFLEPRLYNSFLNAYVAMASNESRKSTYWIGEAWRLYQVMEGGEEKVTPTPSTYAIMLQCWLKFNPESSNPYYGDEVQNPSTLLTNIIDRQISVSSVVSDRFIKDSEDAASVIKLLSKTAVELNLSKIVSELGQVEALGSSLHPDPLADVPEVQPVLRPKPKEDGAPLEPAETNPEPTMEVPFNLSNLRKHLAHVTLARRVLPEDVAARQKLLEESVYDVAVERLRYQAEKFEELGLGGVTGLQHADLQRWMWEWHTKLMSRLEKEIREIIKVEESHSKGVQLGPFLSLVKPHKLSLITIIELMRLQGSGGVADGMKTARALLSVGRAVEVEYKAEMCKRNNTQVPTSAIADELYSKTPDSATAEAGPSSGKPTTQGAGKRNGGGFFTKFGYKDLHKRRVAARKYLEDAEEWTADWTHLLRVKVGSILVNCLMDVARVERKGLNKVTGETITESHPAFYHAYEYLRGQKLGVIRLNPVVSERIAKDGLKEALHPRHLPMLVKPKPWLSHDQGGYLFNKTSAMRYKESQEQLTYLKHASQVGNVELVYAGLDVLGNTPWQINREVFDVVLKVWNAGDRLGKLPPAVYDYPEPEKPDNFEADMKARNTYLIRQKAYVQGKANNHSDRCSVNYKIEIARAFLGDTFYLPHNLDFRGRAYPIPPHLNHIGDDLSRGLLKFGEAKPLGARGLRWLKIHLANLYGFDKGSFDERVAFVENHLKEIYDTAENPLDGMKWWLKADDPWQCLATCFELRAALESPNPEEYASSLPVHQDGTCNGLQHYAALGGDTQGAKQVNLGITDRPSDVYTYVADMVEKILETDSAKGEKYAVMLKGKVARKVVKQTVMTTVYGVTYVGAREQIEKQLKDRKEIPEEECWGASAYLAKQVLFCIGDLFSGAKGIQVWLNLCARIIAKSIPPDRIPESEGGTLTEEVKKTRKTKGPARSTVNAKDVKKEQMTSVVWTTPLGLPIVQPYRKVKKRQVMTSLQTVFISDPNSPAEVNSLKQASAFPPNFIHSLDATHMMLTALECRAQDLTFASVHDSYWTHACDIDKMSTIIRQTFIALHSSDVLGKLSAEFLERYKGYKVPAVQLAGKLAQQLQAAGTQDVVRLIHGAPSEEVEAALTSNEQNEHEEAEEAAEAGLTANEDGDEKPKRRTRKKKVTGTESVLTNKFVELTDLLPPLPKKGNFDVRTIEGSQYFFS